MKFKNLTDHQKISLFQENPEVFFNLVMEYVDEYINSLTPQQQWRIKKEHLELKKRLKHLTKRGYYRQMLPLLIKFLTKIDNTLNNKAG